jgi:Shedu protein SduA, N-terminal
MPVLIENSDDPNDCVKGAFLYQKKGKNDEWAPLNTESLTSVKQGESYKLELHSSELSALGNGLRPLYAIKKSQGVPSAPSASSFVYSYRRYFLKFPASGIAKPFVR